MVVALHYVLEYIDDAEDAIVEDLPVLVVDVLLVDHVFRLFIFFEIQVILVLLELLGGKVVHVAEVLLLKVRVVDQVWVTLV